MNPVQKWVTFSFVWTFYCSCLPLLVFASPLPLKEGDTRVNRTCILPKTIFQQYIRNRTFTLAKLASFSDKDTDNRFIGEHLYTNVQKNDRCYLMMRVTGVVLTNVLSKLKDQQYPGAQEVTFFFTSLHTELSHCKPLGCKEPLERNLKQMKDKLDKLGENGKNKVVGELDMLYEFLQNACTEARKETGKSKKKDGTDDFKCGHLGTMKQ